MPHRNIETPGLLPWISDVVAVNALIVFEGCVLVAMRIVLALHQHGDAVRRRLGRPAIPGDVLLDRLRIPGGG